jgi:hypothetical protein
MAPMGSKCDVRLTAVASWCACTIAALTGPRAAAAVSTQAVGTALAGLRPMGDTWADFGRGGIRPV